jgi:hypothetical protein
LFVFLSFLLCILYSEPLLTSPSFKFVMISALMF